MDVSMPRMTGFEACRRLKADDSSRRRHTRSLRDWSSDVCSSDLVAAGGDGTVNAVVQHLVARGTLAVLPGGTLNHFARDLGVRNPERALEALERGEPRPVDLGRVDGKVFVNGVGLGLYP